MFYGGYSDRLVTLGQRATRTGQKPKKRSLTSRVLKCFIRLPHRNAELKAFSCLITQHAPRCMFKNRQFSRPQEHETQDKNVEKLPSIQRAIFLFLIWKIYFPKFSSHVINDKQALCRSSDRSRFSKQFFNISRKAFNPKKTVHPKPNIKELAWNRIICLSAAAKLSQQLRCPYAVLTENGKELRRASDSLLAFTNFTKIQKETFNRICKLENDSHAYCRSLQSTLATTPPS